MSCCSLTRRGESQLIVLLLVRQMHFMALDLSCGFIFFINILHISDICQYVNSNITSIIIFNVNDNWIHKELKTLLVLILCIRVGLVFTQTTHSSSTCGVSQQAGYSTLTYLITHHSVFSVWQISPHSRCLFSLCIDLCKHVQDVTGTFPVCGVAIITPDADGSNV